MGNNKIGLAVLLASIFAILVGCGDTDKNNVKQKKIKNRELMCHETNSSPIWLPKISEQKQRVMNIEPEMTLAEVLAVYGTPDKVFVLRKNYDDDYVLILQYPNKPSQELYFRNGKLYKTELLKLKPKHNFYNARTGKKLDENFDVEK